MEEVLAECDAYGPDEKDPWTKIAEKRGVVRSTLTRKHRRETRSVRDAHLAQRNLSPQEGAELINYIEHLTTDHLPPAREMVQDFASDIAGKHVSTSQVDRFVNKNSELVDVNGPRSSRRRFL
jgi:proline dehydrogenase